MQYVMIASIRARRAFVFALMSSRAFLAATTASAICFRILSKPYRLLLASKPQPEHQKPRDQFAPLLRIGGVARREELLGLRGDFGQIGMAYAGHQTWELRLLLLFDDRK